MITWQMGPFFGRVFKMKTSHDHTASGKKCGAGFHRTCSHFFWLIANILVIFDKKYASRQKRVLFNCFTTKQCLGMLKMWGKRLFCLSLVLYGSLWLPALSHRNTSNHPRGTWFADILAMKTRLWRDDVGVLEDYLYTQVIQIAAMGAPSVKNWLHSCFFRPPAICWI